MIVTGKDILRIIKKKANAKGITSTALFRKAGIARSTIWTWRTGDKLPSKDTLTKLKNILDKM